MILVVVCEYQQSEWKVIIFGQSPNDVTFGGDGSAKEWQKVMEKGGLAKSEEKLLRNGPSG